MLTILFIVMLQLISSQLMFSSWGIDLSVIPCLCPGPENTLYVNSSMA